ncbi:GNAT family N-acetyltransferase [Brevibacterium renqingii]|uniref:GNAT family N-acetyltransferase n=2 Tax=Brevibacterium renqingii TaxID=2776916 RepID=UPI001AE0CB00|nr:GNAT family N-acetyltransferase [Brevibacterium renqingii]
MDLETIWPPYGLRIRIGDMELSPVRESDYSELAEIARGGVRRDDVQAFVVDWDSGSDEQIARSIAQYQWSTRANFDVDDWTIEFTVRVGGRAVGIQGVNGRHFSRTHTVSTGSWLARSEQGHGYGTQMRWAIVIAFADHCGASTFETAYVEGNEASRRVSEKVGYSPNGSHTIVAQNGEARLEHKLTLDSVDIARPDEAVQVEGAAAFRRFLGLESA